MLLHKVEADTNDTLIKNNKTTSFFIVHLTVGKENVIRLFEEYVFYADVTINNTNILNCLGNVISNGKKKKVLSKKKNSQFHIFELIILFPF
jgi:hypothetical protein